jgi:hypothetical protein
MSVDSRITLPVLHVPQPPPLPFPVGTTVRLKCCPDAPPGRVQGVARSGKVLVAWHDLNITTRHKVGALMLADAADAEHPAAAPQSAQDAARTRR